MGNEVSKPDTDERLQPEDIEGYEYKSEIGEVSRKMQGILVIILLFVVAPVVEAPLTAIFIGGESIIWPSYSEHRTISILLIPSLVGSFFIHEKIHECMYSRYDHMAEVRWLNMYTISNDGEVVVGDYFRIVLAPVVSLVTLTILLYILLLFSKLSVISSTIFAVIMLSGNILLAAGDFYQAMWLRRNSQAEDIVHMKDIQLTDRMFLNKYKSVGHLHEKK